MTLTILNVAYPLAPVGPDAVGGAEQVLAQIDAGLVRAGHQSLVIASEGSQTYGKLLATPRPPGRLDGPIHAAAKKVHQQMIRHALTNWKVDVVHLHGIDCATYLPPPDVAVLITLHLPIPWYPVQLFQLERPWTFLNCVSATQHAGCPACKQLLPAVENGVPEFLFQGRHAKRYFAMSLGRICPEKAFHLAMDACACAGMPFLLAGQVFGYGTHQAYFETEIVPRLDRTRRFIGSIGLRRKRRLLSAAQCLVAPSLVSETSSLVAMEALACGTPVVAFPAGALAEIVEDGKTGFLVRSPRELPSAIRACRELSSEVCRETARKRFSQSRTVSEYLGIYMQLAQRRREFVEKTHARLTVSAEAACHARAFL
jgi:glycosyltransferase involved in cell wall biosynthesis